MHTELYTLDNGLTVILVDTKSFPTLTTILLVGAGSRYETTENNGIAHFFEHMAFKGSQKYPDSFTIASTIEGLGGHFNAYTAKDRTGYWIKSTKEHFPLVIDVISDMVLHSKLLPEEIEKEKGVIVEEINMYEDMPQRRVSELFEELLYGGHPLGYEIAGLKDVVRTFMQKTFTDYMKQLYHPNNAVLVVAGGIGGDTEKMRETIQKAFGKWQPGEPILHQTYIDTQSKSASLVHFKKTEQAHFCLGFRAFSTFSPQKPALSLLTTILGGGMSSRLFMEVREKRGLCYYISTDRELYQDVGNIVTQAGVTNQLDKIREAVTATLEEHKKMINGDITDEEIMLAKNALKGRLLLSLEDSSNVASFYGTKMILEKQIKSPEELTLELDHVTKEEIVAVARDLFIQKNLNFTIIGPVEDKHAFDDVLSI